MVAVTEKTGRMLLFFLGVGIFSKKFKLDVPVFLRGAYSLLRKIKQFAKLTLYSCMYKIKFSRKIIHKKWLS